MMFIKQSGNPTARSGGFPSAQESITERCFENEVAFACSRTSGAVPSWTSIRMLDYQHRET